MEYIRLIMIIYILCILCNSNYILDKNSRKNKNKTKKILCFALKGLAQVLISILCIYIYYIFVMYFRPYTINQHLLAKKDLRKICMFKLPTIEEMASSLPEDRKASPGRPCLTGKFPEHRNKNVEKSYHLLSLLYGICWYFLYSREQTSGWHNKNVFN